jgi:hypothetical protein
MARSSTVPWPWARGCFSSRPGSTTGHDPPRLALPCRPSSRRSTRPASPSLAMMHTREQVRAAWRRPAPVPSARRLPHHTPSNPAPSSTLRRRFALDSELNASPGRCLPGGDEPRRAAGEMPTRRCRATPHRRGDAYEEVSSRVTRLGRCRRGRGAGQGHQG